MTDGARAQTGGPVLDTTQSYSVSAWVSASTLSRDQSAVGQGGVNHGAFFLQYNPNLGRWAFIAPSSDSASPSAYPAATSNNALVANASAKVQDRAGAPAKLLNVSWLNA